MGKRLRLSSNSALQKCGTRKQELEDQISQLPDEILVSILSFLTLKEAAVTSVLSSRWVYLWLFTARLDFDASEALDKIAEENKFRKMERLKYVKWVNRVLQLHKGSTLEEFRVCFDLCKINKHDIDKWLKFALARRVQRLELDLLENGEDIRDDSRSYTFPCELFAQSSGPSLRQPPSNYGGKSPCAFDGFKSLKALCLKCVNVTGEVLEFFLSNCPILEQLVVHGSGQLVDFDVSGPSLMLRYLEICYCLEMKSIKICDTNLVSFKLLGGAEISLLLKNLPLLVEVNITRGYTGISGVFPQLSCCLSQLEILTLHFNKSKINIEHHGFPELTKLKQLVIVVLIGNDASLLGLTSLIKACPHLQKFELKLQWLWPRRSRREIKKGTIYPLQHLKEVEVVGYYGRTSDIELVMYFLENAAALEKIIIDPRGQIPSRIPVEIIEIKEEATARRRAKQQLEGKVPAHVKLVIL